MSGNKERGFTVIETTIFIAVSGMMLVGLLAGTSYAISRQRYTDTIRSTEAFLQQQVERTLSFANSRDDNLGCQGTPTGPQIVSGAGASRAGASRCVVLGKALRFTQDGNRVFIYNVVGIEPANIITVSGSYAGGSDESAILRAYEPRAVLTIGVEEYDFAWGATVAGASYQDATLGTRAMNTVLLLRSPRSGGSMFFTGNLTTWPLADSVPASGVFDIEPLVTTSMYRRQAAICLRSADIGGKTGAIIFTGTAGQDGIKGDFADMTTYNAGTAPCLGIL